ncbi:HNH endonuclease [Xanthocytophaga flava]|uniref:HNH endonuclease n=1 Tax=Xanthocytophaga flava TaxID=3048013 RepID=UPI0028D1C5D0|nr:HNH endonuclease [Xanthocytophaga flavus]MDJ1471880.1 HNH endonuclease [Xanthocytophaga flavus]
MSQKNNWTREELIVVFNLYCKIPFSKINEKYKPVIELASLIGRSPGAVSFKLANFASLDPVLKQRNISGLKNGSKGEKEIWKEFHADWERLSYESELQLARYKQEPITQTTSIRIDDLPQGGDRETIIKARVNQQFFRHAVLTSYETKCCITGITQTELLIASHIIPWSIDKGNRTNPCNGICLNALHDKAFDKGLITITPDFEIKISGKLLESSSGTAIFFQSYKNQKISLPKRFLPDRDFLHYHLTNIYKG